MRRAAVKVGAVMALVGGMMMAGGSPALAVRAGDFCPTLSVGQIVTADNGATVQCQLNGTDSRYHWTEVSPATTLATIPLPTTIAPTPLIPAGSHQTGIISTGPVATAAPATNATGIIGVSPAPTVPAPIAVAAPLQRTG